MICKNIRQLEEGEDLRASAPADLPVRYPLQADLAAASFGPKAPPSRTRVFDIEIDAVNQKEALACIAALAANRRGRRRPAMVVTPNLDHAIRHRRDPAFRRAYAQAALVLADGFPLLWASRMNARPLPACVPGSDLILPLCAEAARNKRSIFILGSTLEVLSIACRRLKAQIPGLDIKGVYAPDFGFSAAHPQSAEALSMINELQPDYLFVALGSPRQESWVLALQDKLDVSVALCVGASFDFLADRPKRAPLWVRRVRMEWLWRCLSDPWRLGRRYAVNLAMLPLMMVEHAWQQRRLGIKLGSRALPEKLL